MGIAIVFDENGVRIVDESGQRERVKRPRRGHSILRPCADYVAVDLETTGLDPKYCEIIEIGAVRVRGGNPVETYQSLVQPSCLDDVVNITAQKCKCYVGSACTEITVGFEPVDICPHCHTGFDGCTLSAVAVRHNEYRLLGVIHRCNCCEKLFCSFFESVNDRPFQLFRSYPKLSPALYIPDNVKKLSPDFEKIYIQSAVAESYGLKDICGMGYRKALEFLVKDYAILLHPDQKDAILATMLGPCIEKYLNDDRLKALAKAAAWLGNDETHYFKRHPEYSVNDLKIFIETALTEINSELTFRKACDLLDPPAGC